MQHPSDLASLVHEYLVADRARMHHDLSTLPELNDLTLLFETLFYLSLQTEEGQPVACSVVFMPPSKPVTSYPSKGPHVDVSASHRVRFPRALRYDIRTLSKLAHAADPRLTALGVWSKRHELSIWGIVDQFPLHLERFTGWESQRQAGVPGLFYVRITAPGELTVYIADRIFAILRQNRLVSREYDALWHGPLSSLLNRYVLPFQCGVQRLVGDDLYGSAGKWFEGTDELYRCSEDFGSELRDFWLGTLCRVLLKVREYRHGGAIII